MTVLEALAILESAVLKCKKRNVNTPEVKAALDSLERYIYPKWLVPQFRDHALKERRARQINLGKWFKEKIASSSGWQSHASRHLVLIDLRRRASQ
jgi:hypothetical protein